MASNHPSGSDSDLDEDDAEYIRQDERVTRSMVKSRKKRPHNGLRSSDKSKPALSASNYQTPPRVQNSTSNSNVYSVSSGGNPVVSPSDTGAASDVHIGHASPVSRYKYSPKRRYAHSSSPRSRQNRVATPDHYAGPPGMGQSPVEETVRYTSSSSGEEAGESEVPQARPKGRKKHALVVSGSEVDFQRTKKRRRNNRNS